MIPADVFREVPVLTGELVELEPLSSKHFEGLWASLSDPEAARLTGTHATFTEAQIQTYLASRAEHHDRADWAIMRRADGRNVGEVVINDLDQDNESANFRISLFAEEFYGRGYGTEATRLVVGYALDVVGLHRLALGVFDFNPRAQRVYEKCGFRREGVHRDELYWDGEWHDSIKMAVLATDPR